jgi:MerR family Zn(II)-responsive transcriptional regulator of zntA
MRIGQIARELGVSADTLRFYEKRGLLPRTARTESGYRDYGPVDQERIRIMLDLRRLDVPPADAARIAGWCQSGHCATASAELPAILHARRAAIRARIEGLELLDARLADLEHHLSLASLPMAGATPCCAAAAALEGVAGD